MHYQQNTPVREASFNKRMLFETYQLGESIFPPQSIFQRLLQNEELIINTPRREREIAHKSHMTPNSILRNMHCQSPDMTTLAKDQRRTSVRQDGSARARQPLLGKRDGLGQLFNHSNEKSFGLLPANPNDTIDLIHVENVHVFPSYSYIFHRSEQREPVEQKRPEPQLSNPFKALAEDEKGIKCNCKNSKCLKLYCECLRRGVTCVGCNCTGCENHQHSKVREIRVKQLGLITQTL